VRLFGFIIRTELGGQCMMIDASYIECSASQPCSMQWVSYTHGIVLVHASHGVFSRKWDGISYRVE